ncbi:hypothetical protein ANCDUO_12416 [Ancylostoma duodenale]|uniref:Anti-proliferative protein domain-containing protein n=1 Tax=Ancylostoma duodenale TaxID=51022 RepID=A0A0C2CLH9_9BILA|nr:hypothetical protein ANCDUO_12416 [Ancylostoma duodenale]
MFIEIEETVCFIASFLYGKIPRSISPVRFDGFVIVYFSRVDSFAEAVANGLVSRIYIRSEPLKSYTLVVNVDENKDNLIEEAASCAFISPQELSELLPANLLLELREGSVHAVNADTGNVKCIYPAPGSGNDMHRRNGRRVSCKSTDARRRPCFRVEFAYPKGSERDERAVAKPNFEVRLKKARQAASGFCKDKSFIMGAYFSPRSIFQSSQCGENGYGHHPFTMPSVYAYLRQKRLLEDAQGDRASSGFVDDDELSDR